jgi:hypothetical protein
MKVNVHVAIFVACVAVLVVFWLGYFVGAEATMRTMAAAL